MGKTWPAVDITIASGADPDLVLAAADDYSPTAVEERDGSLRIFFPTPDIRDRAADALRTNFSVATLDVDDEDWARKQHLDPITVGNITVLPEPRVPSPDRSPATDHPLPITDHRSPITDHRPPITDHRSPITIVIPPSMGFGTGHHATTRLCLAALQAADPRGKFVLDVGTGSGLLAIAAVKLGAAHALGTDDDADALLAANENLAFNNVTNVDFVVSDLMKEPLPAADIVLANLMGALVVRAAMRLVAAVRPGGVLIVSGVLATERDEVRRAFANQTSVTDVQEDEWLCFTIRSA